MIATDGLLCMQVLTTARSTRPIVSASEDSQVYIWDRHTEALLEVLPGHSGSVNAVSWCPSRGLLASASDDGTVRLWSAQGT